MPKSGAKQGGESACVHRLCPAHLLTDSNDNTQSLTGSVISRGWLRVRSPRPHRASLAPYIATHWITQRVLASPKKHLVPPMLVAWAIPLAVVGNLLISAWSVLPQALRKCSGERARLTSSTRISYAGLLIVATTTICLPRDFFEMFAPGSRDYNRFDAALVACRC